MIEYTDVNPSYIAHSVIGLRAFAGQQHEALGLSHQSLEQIPTPPIQIAENLGGTRSRYQIFGDKNADNIVLSLMNYSTQLDDAPVQVGLNHRQQILGPDYAVVGVELFSPAAKLTKNQRKRVSDGDFGPFAERLDGILDQLAPADDQRVFAHGYSFGADIIAEYANLNTLDGHFGRHFVERYGIFEPARTKSRVERLGRFGGRIAVELNFAATGNDLFENIVDSETTALLEAHHIDPQKPFAKQRFMARIGLGMPLYIARNPADNNALITGFGTNRTISQINEISDSGFVSRSVKSSNLDPVNTSPHLVLGEAARGISSGFLQNLQVSANQERYIIDGDHSVADRLQIGSALVLATVGIQPLYT